MINSTVLAYLSLFFLFLGVGILYYILSQFRDSKGPIHDYVSKRTPEFFKSKTGGIVAVIFYVIVGTLFVVFRHG